MLYYLCFSPSTTVGPPLRWGARSGGPISHPHTGRSSQPPRSKRLRELNRTIVVLYCSYSIVSKTPLEQARKKKKKNAIEAAILTRVLDRDIQLSTAGATKRPSLEFVQNSRVFPCFDQEGQQYQKVQWPLVATHWGLIAINWRPIATHQRLVATNQPK